MSNKKNNLVGVAILVSMAIIALVVFQNIPSLSVLGTTSGIEYDYNYAPFSEDYIDVKTTELDFVYQTATFPLYHESDQHYLQEDVPIEKCGMGGLWVDYLNEVCYYDIHKDQRIVYVDGTCTLNTDTNTYDATEILFVNDDIRAIECTFPDDMNTTGITAVQYNLDVKLTFTPDCNQTEFDPDVCVNSWLVQPFKKGNYIVRYDSFGCENHLCTTEWQYRNIAIGILAVVLLIIIFQLRTKFKRGGR